MSVCVCWWVCLTSVGLWVSNVSTYGGTEEAECPGVTINIRSWGDTQMAVDMIFRANEWPEVTRHRALFYVWPLVVWVCMGVSDGSMFWIFLTPPPALY